MAFAQLTYRESLRDIEDLPLGLASKLYHMGFRHRSGARRWPMPTKGATGVSMTALAQRLITQARTLYVDEELGLDLTNTVILERRPVKFCAADVFPRSHFTSPPRRR